MKVDLHLPHPDDMPDEMLEMAAAVAWINYSQEGRGRLWLLANVRDVPEYMYVPLAKMQQMPKTEAVNDPNLETYDPLNELLLSVSPNWEIFPPELACANQTSFDYRIHVLDRVEKSCQECSQIWGKRLEAVGTSGMLRLADW